MVYAQMSFFVEADADNVDKCVAQYCAFAKTNDIDGPKKKIVAFIKSIHTDKNMNSESADCVGLLKDKYGLGAEGAEQLEKQCAQNTSGNRKEAWGPSGSDQGRQQTSRPPEEGQRRQQEEVARRTKERQAWLQEVSQYVPNGEDKELMRACQTYILDFYIRCFPPRYMHVPENATKLTIEELDDSINDMNFLLRHFFKGFLPVLWAKVEEVNEGFYRVQDDKNRLVTQTEVMTRSYTSLHDFSRHLSNSFTESIDTLEELVYMYLQICTYRSITIGTLAPDKKTPRKRELFKNKNELKKLVYNELGMCYIVLMCCDYKPAPYTELALKYTSKLEKWTGVTLPNRFKEDKDMLSFLGNKQGVLNYLKFLIRGTYDITHDRTVSIRHVYKTRMKNYVQTKEERQAKREENYKEEIAQKKAREEQEERVKRAEALREEMKTRKEKIKNKRLSYKNHVEMKIRDLDPTLQTEEELMDLKIKINFLNANFNKVSDEKIKKITGIQKQGDVATALGRAGLKLQLRRHELITAWENGEETDKKFKQYTLSGRIFNKHIELYRLGATYTRLRKIFPAAPELEKFRNEIEIIQREKVEKLFRLKLAFVYYDRAISKNTSDAVSKTIEDMKTFKKKYKAICSTPNDSQEEEEIKTFDLLLTDLKSLSDVLSK